jgi:hypothetical protein
MKDQIELLTQGKSQTETAHSRDVKKILRDLPVKEKEERNQVLDSVAAEEVEETSKQSRAIRNLETVLTWVGYVSVVGVAVALTWAVAASLGG